MNVLITGSSTGIGRATAEKFLDAGFVVYGIDIISSDIVNDNYKHYICDVSDKYNLPNISNVNILINNAGTQVLDRCIDVNLIGTINCTEKYGMHNNIRSIINVVSTSAHNGAEFDMYVASKGGVLSYTKTIAKKISQYGATCNSISPGGVITDMNNHILADDYLYNAVLNETLLHKWALPYEIAEWIFFVCTVNKSMTGQDIIIDNGELCNFNFIW